MLHSCQIGLPGIRAESLPMLVVRTSLFSVVDQILMVLAIHSLRSHNLAAAAVDNFDCSLLVVVGMTAHHSLRSERENGCIDPVAGIDYRDLTFWVYLLMIGKTENRPIDCRELMLRRKHV